MVDQLRESNDLNLMQQEVAEWCAEKGWADDGRTFGDEIALIHSELSEALEAYRDHGFNRFTGTKGNVTDAGSGPYADGAKPEGVASEIADTLVRLLDTCGRHGIDIFAEWRMKMDYNWTRTHRHGGKKL